MNVGDDITDRIYQRLDDQELDIFAAAVEESIDFLSAEVFPQYHEKFPSCGSRDQTKQVSGDIYVLIRLCLRNIL